ncbi:MULTISPECIES: alcohol dehydrogenase family protein [unclassified Roseovarius]|uniref:alcohol dehydrogenase family protein n=1 Tax=unclassified Roseovarius TaxID=2614913 RepID=UPI00273FE990|nr:MULTISPECIES: alcohol dehydrogenase family protein [unclassified Roseovarius]
MAMIPTQMSGVYLTRHGGPDALEWREDIPVPTPGPGQALVRVLAAGVNNTDINTRTGWYSKTVTGATDGDSGDDVESGGYAGALNFPLIQGGDLCGEVVATGADVTGIDTGMRVICGINQPRPTSENPVAFEVIGSEYDGAFAEYCCAPADQLYDVSAAPLSDVELGAMPCAFGTAMALLDRASVGKDDTVLITGASGGVGLAAVQLAALRGARVLAQTSAAKADVVREAGADEILGRGETPGVQSITAAIDLVGGPDWGALLEALRPGGRYATAGAIAGPMVEADLRTIYLNDLTIFGVTFQPPESFAGLVDLINRGKVRPLVSKTYPLKDIGAAQEDFAAKTYPGKLVLLPG